MGGYSYPTPDLKNFRLRRAKTTPFLGVLEQKKSACGGPKIVFLCFWSNVFFQPAAGIQQSWFPKSFYERRNALLLFVKRSSSRADAVPGVFTSVGTRFYYSQNDLDSGSRADAGPGVSTSVGTRFYY